MMEGAAWREKRTWKRTAWAVSHMINISGKSVKNPISADELLKTEEEEVEVRDPGADFEKLWKRHEARQKNDGGDDDTDNTEAGN